VFESKNRAPPSWPTRSSSPRDGATTFAVTVETEHFDQSATTRCWSPRSAP